MLDFKKIFGVLDSASTREEGFEVLKNLKGKDLIEIAKHYNVFLGGAKVGEMPSKIVEAVIGSRLRSEAIRDMKL